MLNPLSKCIFRYNTFKNYCQLQNYTEWTSVENLTHSENLLNRLNGKTNKHTNI